MLHLMVVAMHQLEVVEQEPLDRILCFRLMEAEMAELVFLILFLDLQFFMQAAAVQQDITQPQHHHLFMSLWVETAVAATGPTLAHQHKQVWLDEGAAVAEDTNLQVAHLDCWEPTVALELS
jgi:hypothetical protein